MRIKQFEDIKVDKSNPEPLNSEPWSPTAPPKAGNPVNAYEIL